MEFYQLVSFVAVADEGNMTRAARQLNVSQPAVSSQVKALEEDLGLILFHRTTQGMELTQDGELLRDKAAIVLQDVEEFRSMAKKLRGGGTGEIVLGVNTDPRLLRLKDIYSVLEESSPGISLVVKETMSWDVVSELCARNIDLGFSYVQPEDDSISSQFLGGVELAIVAPTAWRERLTGASLRSLAEFPWVWTSDHCPLNGILEDLFARMGDEPTKAVVVDQEAAILKFVADEVGLGIMPVTKITELADAYGLFAVMGVQRKLNLYLLSLLRRKEELNLAELMRIIKRMWA